MLAFVALPPDVRKGSALPIGGDNYWGFAPFRSQRNEGSVIFQNARGEAPIVLEIYGRAKPFRTSGGKAAN
jgi:hypothetical protein